MICPFLTLSSSEQCVHWVFVYGIFKLHLTPGIGQKRNPLHMNFVSDVVLRHVFQVIFFFYYLNFSNTIRWWQNSRKTISFLIQIGLIVETKMIDNVLHPFSRNHHLFSANMPFGRRDGTRCHYLQQFQFTPLLNAMRTVNDADNDNNVCKKNATKVILLCFHITVAFWSRHIVWMVDICIIIVVFWFFFEKGQKSCEWLNENAKWFLFCDEKSFSWNEIGERVRQFWFQALMLILNHRVAKNRRPNMRTHGNRMHVDSIIKNNVAIK